MLHLILNTIALAALTAGSYTDMKTREVPDWISFSLIFFGLGARLLYATITFDWLIFIQGAAGFLAFLIIALIMFYTRQWGGGDAKILMGLGAIIGLDLRFDHFIVSFLINLFLVGAVYGFAASIFYAIRNKKGFSKEYRKQIKSMMITQKVLVVVLAAAFLSYPLINDIGVWIIILSVALLMAFSFYLIIFVRAVEKSAFIAWTHPSKLTVGDWVARKVIFNRKVIATPNELGLEEKQIKTIQRLYKENKIKKVLVKSGIPFIPSFLLAYICTLAIGNILI